MKRRFAIVPVLAMLSACGVDAPPPETAPPAVAPEAAAALPVTVLATGAEISGANGLHFAPDGRLYVASVMGSEIVVLDPDSGAILERLSDGIDGPDDVAFNAQGDYYWTSILTGEVAGRTIEGERITAASLTPGVNPLTFSDDGRLFVAQCFFGDKLYEVDPRGIELPRLISDSLGPGCGLNGMDWGPDARLYGPRWFNHQVVSFDVDTGEMRIEATGFDVPAAVKFDSKGVLHVLDTGAGSVVRLEHGRQSVVAALEPGLDNLAFDARDRLFVSSFADGAVWRIDESGPTALVPGGIAHPGGLAIYGTEAGPVVVVADLHAIRGFDAHDGGHLFSQRNVLGVGELGSTLAIAADGANLILTSWTDNNVRIWDPIAERNVARFDNLELPVGAIRYGEMLVVAEHHGGRVRSLDTNPAVVFADGLEAPTALETDGVRLWVSDRTAGTVTRIAENGAPVAPVVVASGLEAPEGLAIWNGRLLVREGESGRVLLLDDGAARPLVTLGRGTPPASPAQPPSMIVNDIEVLEDSLYATDELERRLVRVSLRGS